MNMTTLWRGTHSERIKSMNNYFKLRVARHLNRAIQTYQCQLALMALDPLPDQLRMQSIRLAMHDAEETIKQLERL